MATAPVVRFMFCALMALASAACVRSMEGAGTSPSAAPAAEQQDVEVGPHAGAPQQGEAPDAPAAVNPWAEPARQVLLPHCGRCHDGAQPGSLARARAVYDLSEEIWYARITPQQYEGMLGRVRARDAIPDADKTVIERFVGCARDGECGLFPLTRPCGLASTLTSRRKCGSGYRATMICA